MPGGTKETQGKAMNNIVQTLNRQCKYSMSNKFWERQAELGHHRTASDREPEELFQESYRWAVFVSSTIIA